MIRIQLLKICLQKLKIKLFFFLSFQGLEWRTRRSWLPCHLPHLWRVAYGEGKCIIFFVLRSIGPNMKPFLRMVFQSKKLDLEPCQMRIHSPAFQCCGSGIRDKHPGSSILLLSFLIFQNLFNWLRFLFIEVFCLLGGKLLPAFLIPLCCISVHREGHHCGLQVKKLRDPPRLDPVAEKHDLVVHAQLRRWVSIVSNFFLQWMSHKTWKNPLIGKL